MMNCRVYYLQVMNCIVYDLQNMNCRVYEMEVEQLQTLRFGSTVTVESTIFNDEL